MKMSMGLVVSCGMILGWANYTGHVYVNEPKTTQPWTALGETDWQMKRMFSAVLYT